MKVGGNARVVAFFVRNNASSLAGFWGMDYGATIDAHYRAILLVELEGD
jgi:hypothetical protein